MYLKIKKFLIITCSIILSSIILSSCSINEPSKEVSTNSQEQQQDNISVNIKDINEIQSLLNSLVTSITTVENKINIADGKYTYTKNNELVYVFIYDICDYDDNIITSCFLGFATPSKITSINLTAENPDFIFSDYLVKLGEVEESNSVKIETTLYNKKEDSLCDYIVTFRIITEMDHDIKIENP